MEAEKYILVGEIIIYPKFRLRRLVIVLIKVIKNTKYFILLFPVYEKRIFLEESNYFLEFMKKLHVYS